jgi:hypothetical protein
VQQEGTSGRKDSIDDDGSSPTMPNPNRVPNRVCTTSRARDGLSLDNINAVRHSGPAGEEEDGLRVTNGPEPLFYGP